MTMLGPQHVTNSQAQHYFVYGFIWFVGIQYPISAAVLTTISYYAILLPLLFYVLYKERTTLLPALKHSDAFRLYCGFFIFLTVHTLALAYMHEQSLKTLQHILLTYLFVVSAVLFFYLVPIRLLMQAVQGLALLGALSAIISLNLFFMGDKLDNPRLVPVGRAEHEILGSFVYAIAGLCALFTMFQQKILSRKIMFGACVLIIGVMIILTQSRMAMGSYFLCVLIGIARFTLKHYSFLRLFALILGGMLTIVSCLLIFASMREWVSFFTETLMNRGDSFRFALWNLAIEGTKNHPWIGNGMHASVTHPQAHSPHSIYLGTAFHLGLPGVVFFIMILLSAVKTLINCRKRISCAKLSPLVTLLLLNGLLSGITEYSQVVKSPHPMWLIFWMPLAAIIGFSMRKLQVGCQQDNTNSSIDKQR